jgi:hypothetical protein
MILEVLQILMKRTAEGQRKTLMLNTLGEVQTQRSAHILISLTAEQQKSILNWCCTLKASVQLRSLEFLYTLLKASVDSHPFYYQDIELMLDFEGYWIVVGLEGKCSIEFFKVSLYTAEGKWRF